jgi:hypothetical protein
MMSIEISRSNVYLHVMNSIFVSTAMKNKIECFSMSFQTLIN